MDLNIKLELFFTALICSSRSVDSEIILYGELFEILLDHLTSHQMAVWHPIAGHWRTRIMEVPEFNLNNSIRSEMGHNMKSITHLPYKRGIDAPLTPDTPNTVLPSNTAKLVFGSKSRYVLAALSPDHPSCELDPRKHEVM